MITLLASIDKNYGIGNNGKLLFHLEEDLKMFKTRTTGGIVIMGRKTYESIGRALPNRRNLILTRNKDFKPKDIPQSDIFYNEKDVCEHLKYFAYLATYVIGGAEIYKLLGPYCDQAIVTKVDKEYPADTHLEIIKSWNKIHTRKFTDYEEVIYTNPCVKTI